MNKIREIREARGLSTEELGELCDPKTSGKQINRLERGERKLSKEWIITIAKALNCSVYDLVPDFVLTDTDRIAAKITKLSEDAQKEIQNFIDYKRNQEADNE